MGLASPVESTANSLRQLGPPTHTANSLRQVTVDLKPARKLPAVASRPVYQSCGDSRTPPSFCAVLARRPRNQKPIARLRSRSGAVALAFPLVPLRSPFPSYRWPINHQVDFVLFFAGFVLASVAVTEGQPQASAPGSRTRLTPLSRPSGYRIGHDYLRVVGCPCRRWVPAAQRDRPR